MAGLSADRNPQWAPEMNCSMSVLAPAAVTATCLEKFFNLSEGFFPHVQDEKTVPTRRLRRELCVMICLMHSSRLAHNKYSFPSLFFCIVGKDQGFPAEKSIFHCFIFLLGSIT